jgi:pimeloyl-ACP methyl ester carboxylesterase
MFSEFTASHRGGSGSPMVCLHGFMDTWRSWELVLPMLERHHDVLALTLPGHAGGPPLTNPTSAAMIDAVERSIDEAGIGRAHLVGNSLGGYIALALAARGRATTVVAFAPAGGWAVDDRSYADVLNAQRQLHEQAKLAAPHADQLLSSNAGRRRATGLITTNFEHIPAELLAHQMLGVASCRSAIPLLDSAARAGWPLDAHDIVCPVRFVWGTGDRLLGLPGAAGRFRAELPHADWIVLDDVGHCPQLDVPVEAAQLTLGFTTTA